MSTKMLGKIISPEQSKSMLQNSIQFSINDTSTTSEQQMWDEEGWPLKVCTLSRVNAEYDYSRQSTLNTMIEQMCDDQIRMRGRRFCFRLKMWTNYRVITADNLLEGRTGVANKKRRLRSSQWLPTDLSQSTQCYQNSIQTSINDKHKSEQWMWDEEGMTLSRVNAEYDYSRQSTLNTMIE
jgi:hypothetical protein